MPPGVSQILRESGATLSIIFALEALSWWLLARRNTEDARALIGPAVLFLIGLLLVGVGLYSEDVRAAELLALGAGFVIPSVALARPGARRVLRRAAIALVPAAAVGWMVVRGFVVPSIACAQHNAQHGEVHERWRLEYRALMELEARRQGILSQSRMHTHAEKMPNPDRIEIVEAVGPPGGWAYSATVIGCAACRSFYMDSNDRVLWSRRRRATREDPPLHWNELEYLKHVVHGGCYVLGDVLCR